MKNALELTILTAWAACTTFVWAQQESNTAQGGEFLEGGDVSTTAEDVEPEAPIWADALASMRSELQTIKREFLDLKSGIRTLEEQNTELRERMQEAAPSEPASALRDVSDQADTTTAEDGQPVGPSQADALASMQSEFRTIKEEFLNLAFGFRDLDDRNTELTARVQEVAPIGLSPEVRDLIARVEGLETTLAANEEDQGAYANERLDDLSARLDALEAGDDEGAARDTEFIDLSARMEALERRFDSLELTVTALSTAPAPMPVDPDSGSGLNIERRPADKAPFVALRNVDGGLVSVLKRNLSSSDYTLPSSALCASAGTWFDATHTLTDYRAFFTSDGAAVRVCKHTRSGWRDLPASNSERAHIIREVN